jgi:NADH-quinone oxidoreductase subunit M
MRMSGLPLLSLITFSPLVAALIVLVLPGQPLRVPRLAAFLLSLVPFALSLVMLAQFDPALGTLQMRERVTWMPAIGADYAMGVDGFSIWLILLTTFLTPVLILAAWTDIAKRVRLFMALMLILESVMLGALCATDLLLFFFFWEFMLFPMAFVIWLWGHDNRVYAAMKFIVFTLAGSAFMLVGIIYLAMRHAELMGRASFDIETLYATPLSYTEQVWLFAAFTVAFMVKVPMVPLHTWLPDAHTEAPTGGSVALAGVLLKMGAYAFLRFSLPLFPLAAQDAFPLIVLLAVIGIIYGALVAYPQPDMKRLVAYSSVSHMGFIMLGLYAFNRMGVTGGVLQMVNHGLSTGALFILVGLIYDRTHTRDISRYGGMWGAVPIWSALFLVVTLSSIGLPGLNGFVGEFLILAGAFRAHPVAAAVATIGIVLGALYMLTMYQRVVFGEPSATAVHATHAIADLNLREICAAMAMVLCMVWIGVYPKPFTDRIQPTVDLLLTRLAKGGATRYLVPPSSAPAPVRHAQAH